MPDFEIARSALPPQTISKDVADSEEALRGLEDSREAAADRECDRLSPEACHDLGSGVEEARSNHGSFHLPPAAAVAGARGVAMVLVVLIDAAIIQGIDGGTDLHCISRRISDVRSGATL